MHFSHPNTYSLLQLSHINHINVFFVYNCWRYQWEIIPKFLNGIIGQLFHPIYIMMYCWFHVFYSHKFQWLICYYTNDTGYFLVTTLLFTQFTLILCCKQWQVFACWHDITKVISMLINSKLRCLHRQLGSALVQICHSRARSDSKFWEWQLLILVNTVLLFRRVMQSNNLPKNRVKQLIENHILVSAECFIHLLKDHILEIHFTCSRENMIYW